jgi:hypothetical protein
VGTRRRWTRLHLALLISLSASAARAQQPAAALQSYPVSQFVIEYPLPHPDHPPISELEALSLEMRVTRGGLMEPHPGAQNVRFPLGEVPPGTRILASGLQYVNRQVIGEFERRGIGAVIVTLPDLEERTGRDLRAVGEQRLRIRIWTGRVENIATIADGDRFRGTLADRTNRPEHRFIRDGSPVRAGGEDSLVRSREIEDYARRLSRHPGRRVDAVLEPGALPGTTRLDYHVAEQKPWLVYGQVGNYGTEGTTELRQRFGLSHTQLTGNDDVLRLDYVTGNFDEVHAGFGSYEVPVWRLDRLRFGAYGSYSEYDASEVGEAQLDYHGDQWEGGARLTGNAFQYGGFFLDAFGGARFRRVGVENEFTISGQSGEFGDAEQDFFLPELGIGAHYTDLLAQLDLELGVEWNWADVAGTESSQLVDLGRTDADAAFELFRWAGALSFYLEPILLYGRGWRDPGSPTRSTLAHEVVLSTRGQYSFGDRLVPQFQQVAGGMYTVRGYEMSIVAGDTAVIGTAEYRLHLARLLDPGGDPIELPVIGPFHATPRTLFARPDWDLILKAFMDGGLTWVEDPDDPNAAVANEEDEDLFGVGVGVELQFMRYFSAGLDVAFPRSNLADGSRGGNYPELHFLVTVMF